MKKLVITAVAIIAVVAMTGKAFAAADQTLSSSVSATVGGIFSLEFYTDANVLYSTSVPFSSVDPQDEYNYADNRAEDDGKSDIGLLVTTNQGSTWYLKIGVNAGSTLLGKLGYYMGQPTNRNWGSDADGGIGHGDWFTIPVSTSPETMYTAGNGDKNNTPLGTLATLSYKINGAGLTPGGHAATATYTLTESI